MKIKNVFDEIFSMENLYKAMEDASRGRRYRSDVLKFTSNAWENLKSLRNEIISGAYSADNYKVFYVYEPKKRMIMSLPFRDRVAQWAVYRIINPIYVKGYISDSYGCIPGRGALSAVKRLQSWLYSVSKKSDKMNRRKNIFFIYRSRYERFTDSRKSK